jgi:hypothetical protein
MKLNIKVLLSFVIISIIIVFMVYPNDEPIREGMRTRLEPEEILHGTEDGYEEPQGFDFDDHTGDISAPIEERNGREDELDTIARSLDDEQDPWIKKHPTKNVKPNEKPSREEKVKPSGEEIERTERAKQTHSSHAELPSNTSKPSNSSNSNTSKPSNSSNSNTSKPSNSSNSNTSKPSKSKPSNPYDCLGKDGQIDPKKCPDALSYCEKPTKLSGNCEEAVITIDGKQYKQCYGICTDPDKCIDDEMCKGITEYLPV